MYQRPVMLPSGNPYAELQAPEYFRGHDPAAKVVAGAGIALRAEKVLGRRGKLLEVGCGRGELLRGARERGWQVAGVDLTPWEPPVSDIPIEIECLERARSLEVQHDVIVLAGVLEHLYEPSAALARVCHALIPGGLLYIDVPNECSFWSRLGRAYMLARGRDWAVSLSPTFSPFHVVGFCPRSLKRLLDQHGLEICTIEMYSLSNRLPRTANMMARMERTASCVALHAGQALGMGAGIICWAARR